MSRPFTLRNVARYCRDVERNVPLYEALGFRASHAMPGFATLQHEEGLHLVLHEGEPEGRHATAIGFTLRGEPEEARAYLEKAGWRLLRAPDEEDRGLFWIYGDLDGNPVNLVAQRRHA